jgi:hypothetical protein
MFRKCVGQVLTLALTALVVGGCVTARDVERIVQDANRDSVVASLAENGSLLEPQPGQLKVASWEDNVSRIEDFVVNHPDQPQTNNALRIREAVLLLNAGQTNLARAVFAEIDRGQLAGERDLAIYDAREHLVWWYGLSRSMSDQDRTHAREALSGLARVADNLDQTSYTRRFLEETRVRVGLRLAQSLSSEADVQSVLEDATVRYAGQFDEADRKAIQMWHLDHDLASGVTLQSLRWYDYVPNAFARADEIIEAACRSSCPTYTPDWVSCIKARSCQQADLGS